MKKTIKTKKGRPVPGLGKAAVLNKPNQLTGRPPRKPAVTRQTVDRS